VTKSMKKRAKINPRFACMYGRSQECVPSRFGLKLRTRYHRFRAAKPQLNRADGVDDDAGGASSIPGAPESDSSVVVAASSS